MFDQLRDYMAMESAKRECRFAEAARFADQLTNHPVQMNRICSFFGYEPYATYGPDWEGNRLRQLAAKTDGSEGRLLAVLPEVAHGRSDPFDSGRFAGWQQPGFDDSPWQPLRTSIGWEQQGFTDPHGHVFRGVMWYRVAVDLPADSAGRSTWLCAPAVVNEAWVWVNGQYAGHRPYQMPWFRPQPVDLDLTPFLRPGQRNQITLRVLNNIDVFGASGIYERMFLYAKDPTARP
jgi:hypothetical protein